MKIIDSDAFTDMPQSSQLLYFHLGMRADDDGFVSSPKKIIRMVGSADDDYKILIAKRFIIPFESGVCVIKHWRIHNYIQNDRYKETVYLDEKKSLILKDNGSYTECIQDVSKLDTQVKLNQVKSNQIKLELEREAKASPQLEINSSLIENLIQKGFPRDLVEFEIKKFISYWTESSRQGKQRWQGEKYFDISRRLASWFSRIATDYKKIERKHINLDNIK